MKKPFDVDELDATLKSLDEESNWNQEHRERLKERIFQDVKREDQRYDNNKRIPYKYYFSLAGAALLLWILFAPMLFQQIGGFPFGGDVTGGEGAHGTIKVFAPFVMVGSLIFLSVLAVGTLLVWKNQSINQLFWKSEGFGFLLPAVRAFVKRGFSLLVIMLAFYFVFTNLNKVPFIQGSDFRIFVALMIMSGIIGFGGRWIGKRFQAFPFHYPVQIFGSLLIMLFFSYQMFTTHFYTGEYLIETGIEKIEWNYELSEPTLTDAEFRDLAEATFAEPLATHYVVSRLYAGEEWGYAEIGDMEILEFNRRSRGYDLIVEVEVSRLVPEGPELDKAVWSYTFKREGGDFKIEGFWKVERYGR